MASIVNTSPAAMINSPAEIPSAILDQAIDWLVKLHAGTTDQRGQQTLLARIASWRAAHPLHEAAWCELQASQPDFSQLTPLALPPALAVRTLNAAQDHLKKQQSRRRALFMLGLGVTGGALTAASQWSMLSELGADYATAVGAQQTVILADGTRVRLNTDSALDVDYSDSRRLLKLRRGEIFIDTGKDSGAGQHRPFWVQTRETRLQALGTQFLVQQEAGRTRLLVTQGRVAIYFHDQLSAIAHPGDAFLIESSGSVTPLSTTATLDPTGWIDNALVVKQMRLADFVTELARYRRGWLYCDPAIADLRVSGVFQIDDTDRALDALARSLPVQLEFRSRFWVTLRAAVTKPL